MKITINNTTINLSDNDVICIDLEGSGVKDLELKINGTDGYRPIHHGELFDMDLTISQYEERLQMFQDAVFKMQMNTAGSKADIEVSRRDFLAIYNKHLTALDNAETIEDEAKVSHIYGKTVSVHWDGICCDCGDGAIPCNYIINAVEGVCHEEGDF